MISLIAREPFGSPETSDFCWLGWPGQRTGQGIERLIHACQCLAANNNVGLADLMVKLLNVQNRCHFMS